MGAVLIHFVAGWAEPICGPHRAEVANAAERLGAHVRECECDESGAGEVRSYNVLNVPAVAIEGRSDFTHRWSVGRRWTNGALASVHLAPCPRTPAACRFIQPLAEPVLTSATP